MKVTKKQRKQAHRNAMVEHSMSKGEKFIIGGIEYRGRPKIINEFGDVAQHGMPFVRQF